MKVRYRRLALRDIEEILQFLQPRSPSGANTVLKAIYNGIGQIADYPYSGTERTSDPDIRVKVIGRYRYKIFYSVISSETIEIIHIRHTSRRPW